MNMVNVTWKHMVVCFVAFITVMIRCLVRYKGTPFFDGNARFWKNYGTHFLHLVVRMNSFIFFHILNQIVLI